MSKINQIWTITNGNRGNEVNCEGLCAYLDADNIRPITVARHWFNNITAPYWPSVMAAGLDHQISAPWPDMVIASSRIAAPYARYIKNASGGKTFTAYLQDPQCNPKHFDFIWAPEHDKLYGPNVFNTLLSPHKLTPRLLSEEGAKWVDRFSDQKRNILGVVIGGPNSAYQFAEDEVLRFTEQLIDLSKTFYLIISVSRRTPAELTKRVLNAINPENAYIYSGTGDNPYPALLNIADALLVTADSVNMTGEACASGKPVYVLRLSTKKRTKFELFQDNLEAQGLTKAFKGQIELWDNTARDDTPDIAKALLNAYSAHKAVNG